MNTAKKIKNLKDRSNYIKLMLKANLSRIWVLVDSNQNIYEPALVFTNCTFFFIWMAYPCSVAVDSNPPSKEQLWDLNIAYGMSIRNLFVFTSPLDCYCEVVTSETQAIN